MLLHDLVVTSTAVAQASSRLVKIGQLATLLQRLAPAEVEIAIAFLSGEPRQGRIGIGPSAMRDARPLASAASPALQLIEVDEVFERIAATAGRGSPADRVRMLRELLARATGDEQDFLIRLLFGELGRDRVQRCAGSPHYPGGLALRFARVKSYRTDKMAADADTIETVREIYRRSSGGVSRV